MIGIFDLKLGATRKTLDLIETVHESISMIGIHNST